MDNPDFMGLYESNLNKFRKVGGVNQYVGQCMSGSHEDNNPSLSVNIETGLFCCHACDWSGNAEQFANHINHPNPKEFHVYNNGDGGGLIRTPELCSSVASPPKSSKPPVPPPNLKKLMEQYKTNLKNNMDKFPYHTWVGEELLIEEMDIGLDEYNNLVFGYRDSKGNLIGIKIHKKNTTGDGRNKWYLPHLIATHQHEKDVFITEGEKCCLCLISRQIQATTGTTGCQSIPKNKDGYYDLEWLQYYTGWIYICYDNDDAGRKGAEKLANAIIEKYKSHKIAIIQWDKSLPVGWDIFDSYGKHPSGQEFQDAVLNAKEIKPKVTERFGGLKFKSGVDIMKSKTEPTFELIEAFLPQCQQILIAGTKKANKSTMCMQMGMALANNEKTFLEFDINAQGMEVLYFDMEVGENQFDHRFKQLATIFPNFTNSGAKRFNRVCKVKAEPNMLQKIDDAVNYYRPDVVFIDPLYKITAGADIGKANQLFPITEGLEEIKIKYNSTVAVIHHLLKGNHELGLQDDRMAGSSELGFWMEHCVLITKSNEPFMRMLTWGDSRSIATPDQYYGLEFDPKDYSLTNTGVIEDWEKYIMTAKKKKSYEYYLSFMEDEFTTDDWHKKTWDDEIPGSTSEKWLYHMEKCKLIVSLGYSKWKKKLKEIVDVTA